MSQPGFHLVGSAPVVQAAYDLRETLLGNPKPPTHVGGGRHVDAPETWDGTGPTPPGWTKEHAPILQHPTNPGQRATLLDDFVLAEKNGPNANRLNGSQHASLQGHLNSAVALGSEWVGAQPVSLVVESEARGK